MREMSRHSTTAAAEKLPLLLLLAIITIPLRMLAEDAEEHSIFSWDFSHELGSLTWWNKWYPACAQPYQAPYTINWETGIADSTETFVINTVTGHSLVPLSAIVAYNSTFNIVRCDMSADDTRFHLYWKPADGHTTGKGPEFRLERMVFLSPSEHKYGTKLVDAEIRYNFAAPSRFPLSEHTPMMTDIDSTSDVAFSVLLRAVKDGDEDPSVEVLLQQILLGYDTGVTRITPHFPSFAKLVHYKGSMTTPPCRGNVHHFVGAVLVPIAASTLEKFRSYGPHWADYRSTTPPDDRFVRFVGLDATGLLPRLRAAPYISGRVIRRNERAADDDAQAIARCHGAVQAGSLCAVALVATVVLLIERATNRVPYSLTWRLPRSKREVFGVPLRYGEETGHPKLVSGTDDVLRGSAGASYAGAGSSNAATESDANGSHEDRNGEGPIDYPISGADGGCGERATMGASHGGQSLISAANSSTRRPVVHGRQAPDKSPDMLAGIMQPKRK